MTTTRRMVYAQIANAVLAGLPEPELQEFGPDAVVRLTFDRHAAADEWQTWLGPDCYLNYTVDAVDVDRSLRCCHGKRSDWSWQIVGREPIAGRDQGSLMAVDGNDRPTVEQLTVAILSPDSLVVPCPRCGHDENVHEADSTPPGCRCCLDCAGFCSPVVLVPAGIEGWGIDGRAGT